MISVGAFLNENRIDILADVEFAKKRIGQVGKLGQFRVGFYFIIWNWMRFFVYLPRRK